MKRPARNSIAAVVDQKTRTPQHFFSGTAGKSKEQDRPGVYANLHEMRDAVDQGAGLAGAGAGDHQKRTFERCCRLILGWVELLGVIDEGGPAEGKVRLL